MKVNLYPEMNEKIADILAMGDEPEQYAAEYIKALRAENERLRTAAESAVNSATKMETLYKVKCNELEVAEKCVSKKTAKEILTHIGNIEEDDGIKLKDYQWFIDMCVRYGVEIKE